MKYPQEKEVGAKTPQQEGSRLSICTGKEKILYPLHLPVILWLYHHRSCGGEGLNPSPWLPGHHFLLYTEFHLLKT